MPLSPIRAITKGFTCLKQLEIGWELDQWAHYVRSMVTKGEKCSLIVACGFNVSKSTIKCHFHNEVQLFLSFAGKKHFLKASYKIQQLQQRKLHQVSLYVTWVVIVCCGEMRLNSILLLIHTITQNTKVVFGNDEHRLLIWTLMKPKERSGSLWEYPGI